MILLGLGSNLGDRLSHLSRALRLLSETMAITRVSSVYASPAMLPPDAPESWDMPYLNLVIAGETKQEPRALLHRCAEIEAALGRAAKHPAWSPRTVDIDMLAYHDMVMNDPALTLPHPGISERAFVLQPLAEILPAWCYPGTNNTASVLLKQLTAHGTPPAIRTDSRLAFK